MDLSYSEIIRNHWSIFAEEKAAIRIRAQPKKIFISGISPKIAAAKAIP